MKNTKKNQNHQDSGITLLRGNFEKFISRILLSLGIAHLYSGSFLCFRFGLILGTNYHLYRDSSIRIPYVYVLRQKMRTDGKYTVLLIFLFVCEQSRRARMWVVKCFIVYAVCDGWWCCGYLCHPSKGRYLLMILKYRDNIKSEQSLTSYSCLFCNKIAYGHSWFCGISLLLRSTFSLLYLK